MAKETAKQRKEREAVEAEMYRQQQETSYPRRFRESVDNAIREGFELRSVNPDTGAFQFYDNDREENYLVFDTFFENDSLLDDFAWAVNRKRAEREENERKYELRKATLAKLTAEEREVLGV